MGGYDSNTERLLGLTVLGLFDLKEAPNRVQFSHAIYAASASVKQRESCGMESRRLAEAGQSSGGAVAAGAKQRDFSSVSCSP